MSFKPIFRMMVCSDVHYGDSKLKPEMFDFEGQEISWFENSIKAAYTYAGLCEYNKIDVLCAVGDFVTSGRKSEMLDFKSTLDNFVKEETEIVLTMASHEYFYDGIENSTKRFIEIFNQQPMHHTVNKGFHIISVSNDEKCHTLKPKQDWLADNLRIARDDDPKKPLFVMYHPQLSGTVYGNAVLWRSPEVMRILMNYPQVVCFSGHSHASINDPRTVHQKYFTCFGTGSIVGTSMCNADRLDYSNIKRQYGNSQFLIVEVDSCNRVRVLPMDTASGKFFNDGWIVEDIHNPDGYTYTDDRYLKAKQPQFPDNAVFSAVYSDNKLKISVTQAFDGEERVPGYQFVIKNSSGLIIRQFGMPSGYHLFEMPESVEFTIDFCEPHGNYSIECYAQSYFDKNSKKIRTTFSV